MTDTASKSLGQRMLWLSIRCLFSVARHACSFTQSCPAILEWVAIPFSRGSFQPRDQSHISFSFCISRGSLYHLGNYTAGPCPLSILDLLVCICDLHNSQSIPLLPLLPLDNRPCLFSLSVSLFLLHKQVHLWFSFHI